MRSLVTSASSVLGFFLSIALQAQPAQAKESEGQFSCPAFAVDNPMPVLAEGKEPVPPLKELPTAAPPREKANGEATDKKVREAIARSLPFVEKGGVDWIQKRGCMSCHTFAFTIWAHQEAKRKGFDVPKEKMEKWLTFARTEAPGKHRGFKLDEAAFKSLQTSGIPEPLLAKLKALKDKFFPTEKAFADELTKVLGAEDMNRHKDSLIKAMTREEKVDSGDPDTYAPLILASTVYATEGFDKDWMKLLSTSLGKTQSREGNWSAGGQLPGLKRSREEGNGVTTMWTILALTSQAENEKSLSEIRDRAMAWLKKQQSKPNKTTESLILYLLIQNKIGDPVQAKALLKDLLAEQRSDGGWSWARGGTRSDAFATGQTLYALTLWGTASSEPAIQRARKYLLQTQQADGSWLIVPDEINNAATEDRLKRTGVIWTYWGSAWATIGLLNTLN